MVSRSSRLLLPHSRAMAAVAAVALLLVSGVTFVYGQTQSFCEGELGQADWACETLSPVSPEVFEVFLPLPGSPDPNNPATYKQIAGEPAFDEDTGLRNEKSAVFVLTEGTYICMLAESNGEAVLFDALEGGFVSSTTEYPTSSWLPESVGALLAQGTKLKYIVYTHAHWDHIGAAGLVADYFAADEPLAISSRRTRWTLKKRAKGDPTTVFGNNRGVPLPEWYKVDVLRVGGLRFVLEKLDIHHAGDYLIFLDKTDQSNADEGIASSIALLGDGIPPGWSPYFSLDDSQDTRSYIEGINQVNDVDFDILVGGHLTKLGTKEDVQILVDFVADVLAGAELGLASVSLADVIAGTGVNDPTNPNTGNAWLLYNELYDRIINICYDYVVDSSARGRDWLAELGGVECWKMQIFASAG